MSEILHMKRAPVNKRSRMDTIEITQSTMRRWLTPPFQRPIKTNEKVRQIAEEIRESGGVVPGTITLGVIDKGRDAGTYIVDGQHRLHALDMSLVPVAYADVRIVEFDSMAEMGLEFTRLNSAIVRMTPDDVLRGLEASNEALQILRKMVPFLGYDKVRRSNYSRNASAPFLSMSAMIRAWQFSTFETPGGGSQAVAQVVEELTPDSAKELAHFLTMCYGAWGRDDSVHKLWGVLNLALCMWLWRRMVLDTDRSGNKRSTVLKAGQFQKCLMALRDEGYTEWLVGRTLGDKDRSPAYTRMRHLFARRLKEEGLDLKMPQPVWAAGG